MFIAFSLSAIGFLLSVPFCTNWGMILFDVIDHYFAGYILFLVGIMECFGVGWCYDSERTKGLSE